MLTHSNTFSCTSSHEVAHRHAAACQNAPADQRVVLKINSWWFFVRMALEHDIGFARAYMAGELEVRKHARICLVTPRWQASLDKFLLC